jgi:hypothetical protein
MRRDEISIGRDETNMRRDEISIGRDYKAYKAGGKLLRGIFTIDSKGRDRPGKWERLGEIVEHLIAPNLIEKFKAEGFDFAKSIPNYGFYDSNHQQLAEVDILLENTTTVMAVEVKSKLLSSHVHDHVKRMDTLRRIADEHDDRRVWLGAVGGALVSPDVPQAARKAGFYLLEQSGDTVRLLLPPDFKPKKWTFHAP